MLKPYLKSIADAIRTKKGTFNTIKAQDFPDEILSIESVGSVTPYRPSGWLDMPDVPKNTIVLLLFISPPAENFVAFKISCGGPYLVEYGTMVNKSFVPAGSVELLSGVSYEETFLYEDWGDELSDGTRQVMLRITSTVIYSFELTSHRDWVDSYFRSWDIVEFIGNLPECTKCKFGAIRDVSALRQLRYFSLEGTNKIKDYIGMFTNCVSLERINALDTSYGQSFDSICENCESLNFVCELDIRNGTILDTMFAECHNLRASPLKNTGAAISMYGIFFNCTSLAALELDVSNVDTTLYMVTDCKNLKSIKFTGTTRTTWPSNLQLEDTALSRQAIIELFHALPTITTKRSIIIQDTPGSLKLTPADKAIAEVKNWAVY